MSVNLTIKVLAGAVALALAGAASASMNTSGTTASIVLNVFDETTGASFSYDTGLSGPTFNANQNYTSGSLASDVNYQAFLGAVGSDALDYSVSGGLIITSPNTRTAYFTADLPPVSKSGAVTFQGASYIIAGYTGLNATTSTTSNSAFNAAGSLNSWWQLDGSGAGNHTNTSFGVNSDALVGTAQEFYSEFAASNGALSHSVVTDLLGKWNFSGATLTFTSANVAPIPLPTPMLLLLSGLGLMGVIARRGKSSTAGDSMFGASVA